MPSRVVDPQWNFFNGTYYPQGTNVHTYPSVQYQIRYSCMPNWTPFVTSINMDGTNDCIGYINKLKIMDTNASLVISASANGYRNTNYMLDNVRHGTGYGVAPDFLDVDYSTDGFLIAQATNALLSAGVPTNQIIYNDGLDIITFANGTPNFINAPQITNAANVAAYMSWGSHSALGVSFPTDGDVIWDGNSGWWIMATMESFNGQRFQTEQSTFMQWFSSNSFGGTYYLNTPIAAVSHVDEPTLGGIESSSDYFGLWAEGKNFAISAWSARGTVYYQAVGDPLITK